MSFKFVHIGHHKCGSTWLQYGAFPKIRELLPLEFEDHSFPEQRHNYESLMYLNHTADLFYDPSRLDTFKNSLGETNYLSWEGLVGHGTLEGPPGMSIRHTAERMKYIFDPKKILFVIRNQKTWLPSFYLDDIQFGYVADFKAWTMMRKDFQHLNWVRYAPTIKCYQDIYGKENVKVVLFEDLFSETMIRSILDNFEINSAGIEDIDFKRKHNPALSKPSFVLTRLINRHCGSKANMGEGTIYNWWRFEMRKKADALAKQLNMKPMKPWFDGFDELMHDEYHEDNVETARLTGLDLAGKGYP